MSVSEGADRSCFERLPKVGSEKGDIRMSPDCPIAPWATFFGVPPHFV
jgi:hypothetical protein